MNHSNRTARRALLALGGLAIVSLASAQAAPPLRYLQAVAVSSQRFPSYENIGDYQGATVKDHGGTYIIVVTRELGISSNVNRYATLNGKRMEEARTDRILDGNRIIGYYRYWRLTGNLTGGTFKYSASSVNFPYNQMSDTLLVR